MGGMRGDDKGDRGINRLAESLRRVMVRTGDGRLRPLWRAAYRAVARGVSAYLRAGRRGASVYAIGSLAGPDAVYGISDIDLTVVVPAGPGPPGQAREAAQRRWERLCRLAPSLRQLVFVAVYEEQELRRAATGSPCLRSAPGAGDAAAPALFGPAPFVDPVAVASRPMLQPPARAWRLLAGRRRLPAPREPDAHQRGMIAWLELQHWWRYAFGVAARPDGPRTAYLCVKLASEPARIWLWLVQGERVSSRRQALVRGGQVLPAERRLFERALALQGALAQSPDPQLAEMLAGFLRLTRRIADRLAEEVEAAGVQEVGLTWGPEEELVLAPSALGPLATLLGVRPRLLPLVDWRALVRPSAPDEAIAPVPGHPSDLTTLGAAATAGRADPYAALRDGDLLVLPAPLQRRTFLRAVQCPVTDPFSFALLDGAAVARVPRARGWSIEETAIRATAEHRAWLKDGGATREASVEALGLLFTAARAGLLLESVERGQPEIALTVAAVAESLAASTRMSRSVAGASYEAYRACRAGGSPPASVMADLRRCVAAMPAYRDPAPVVACA